MTFAHRPRRSVRLALILAVLSLPPWIGPASGDLTAQDRFVVFSSTAGAKRASLLEMDDAGRIIGTITTFAPDFAPQDVIMAEDNRSFLVVGYDPFAAFGARILSVSPAGVVQTLAAGRPMSSPIRILPDFDGSYLILDRPPSAATRIIRWQPGLGFWGERAVPLVAYGGLVEPANGGLILRAHATGTFPPSTNVGYFGVDLLSGAVTTVVTANAPAAMDAQYGAHAPLYRPGFDDVVDAIYDQALLAVELHAVAPGTLTAITQPLFLQFPMDVERTSDRSLPTRYRVFTRHMSVPIAFQLIRVRGDGTPLTSVLYSASADFDQTSPLVRIGNRTLGWDGAGTPVRRLAVRVPDEAGRPYAVALSLAGLGAGVPLGDGRIVPITPDALTLLTLQDLLPGVVTGARGTLDRSGHATLTLDTTALGRLGIPLWAAAVVLDANAPAGVAEVLGPTRIRLF